MMIPIECKITNFFYTCTELCVVLIIKMVRVLTILTPGVVQFSTRVVSNTKVNVMWSPPSQPNGIS